MTSLKPRKQPIQGRARATVAAILEAAAQVFEASGIAGATTDRIALRAGVSVGTLYQYFPNKEAILVSLAEQHAEQGIRRVRERLALAGTTDQPLEDLLRHLVAALVTLHRRAPRLQRLIRSEARLPADHADRLDALEDSLAAEIVTLIEAHPAIAVPDPRLAAWVVVHAAEGLVHDFVVHPPGCSDEAFTEEMSRLLAGYLRR